MKHLFVKHNIIYASSEKPQFIGAINIIELYDDVNQEKTPQPYNKTENNLFLIYKYLESSFWCAGSSQRAVISRACRVWRECSVRKAGDSPACPIRRSVVPCAVYSDCFSLHRLLALASNCKAKEILLAGIK